MKETKYNIVNNFTDIYTGEHYETDHEPVSFSPDRVKEILAAEKAIGYKLIEEAETKTSKATEKKEVVEETTEKNNKKNK